jgi:crotonobetainyl-CoA:carnitine CoA-transferase CaiB-like acyl-CoA transferase
MQEGALHGIRVMDFTWLLAGPYATRILADFGAEVIKVQSAKISTSIESNVSGYFNMWNRNKLGITIDMTHPESKELIINLVKSCDVVIENFSPRVMANWGLSYETLKEVKSDIIMVSLSGMGHSGPWENFVALGPTIQALSGLTYLTSYSQDAPVGMGYSYADPLAGLFAALATLVALEYRAKTGKGQYVDISEYEAMCSLLGPAILDYSVNHNLAVPRGNVSEYVQDSPYGCYQCKGDDRWCVITVRTDEEWCSLCKAMGDPAWAKQEKFSSLQMRLKNKEELEELLEKWTFNHTPEEIISVLQQFGVPCGPIENAADLANDPQLESRGFFIQLHHPVLGNIHSDGTPIVLSRTPAQYKRAAPLLGQDNHYVFQVLLGLSDEEFSRYISKGIIS